MMRNGTSSFKLCLEALEDRLCPASYSVIDLVPVAGGTWARANGVNDTANLVAGDSSNDGYVGAAVWTISAGGQATVVALPEIVARASSASDVNNARQVVGFSDTTFTSPDPGTPNTPHAVLWQLDAQGAVTSLTDLGDMPNYPYTSAGAINNLGQVLGDGTSTTGVHIAFLWDSTNGMRDLNTLLPIGSGWQVTGATDINDNGQIVGVGVHGGAEHGFRFDLSTSTIVDIGVLPGGIRSAAYALNNLGGVVGSAETARVNRCGTGVISDAFIFQNGTMTDLGSLADAGSRAIGVNDSGTVVGRYFKYDRSPFASCHDTISRAFLWQNGTMRDLGKQLPKNAKWTLFGASDINSTGRIVGNGLVGSGSPQEHGYLLLPTNALTAATLATKPATQILTVGQSEPLLDEALTRWQAAGDDTSALVGLDLRIADLGGTTLGLASGHTIYLDDNAAGWGWFVDSTPRNDREFVKRGNQGEKHRMDLLTVLTHEVGHLLGFEHDESGSSTPGVMHDTLAAGTRTMPGETRLGQDAALLNLIFADDRSAWRRKIWR